MDDPIAGEFRIAFDEMNYGVDMRLALDSLVERVPSMSLMAVVTTVWCKGSRAAIWRRVSKTIARLIRGRFRFGAASTH